MPSKNKGAKMKSINDWLNAYGESHQNSTNKLIHWFCVPLITFTLLGLLSLANWQFNINENTYRISLSTFLFIAAIFFYIRLSITITIGMTLFTGLSLFYINILENSFDSILLIKYYLFIFIVAWIGQFIGHKIEGKKPSFVEDIKFLLIGPAWLLSFLYKKLNIPL